MSCTIVVHRSITSFRTPLIFSSFFEQKLPRGRKKLRNFDLEYTRYII